jgi:hypothetical protein
MVSEFLVPGVVAALSHRQPDAILGHGIAETMLEVPVGNLLTMKTSA